MRHPALPITRPRRWLNFCAARASATARKAGVVEEGEAHLGRAHPQVRRSSRSSSARCRPSGARWPARMKPGRFRSGGGECARLVVPFRDVAGDAVIPYRRPRWERSGPPCGGRHPSIRAWRRCAGAASGIPPADRPRVRMGMRGRVLVAEFEDQLAGRIGRRIVAPGWVGGGLRGEGERAGEEQDDRESPTKRHKF